MEQDIYINQIYLDRAILRGDLDPEYIQRLAESIRSMGLLQAILVRAREGGGWSLIAGRQRLEACKSLEWTTIPARIRDAEEIDEIPAITENLVRKNLSPFEESKAVGILHHEKKMSVRDIAEALNHGHRWVQDRLALLELPPELQTAVHCKYVTIAGAQLLDQITDKPLVSWYIHLAKTNGATISQCNSWLMLWQATQALAPGGIPTPSVPYSLAPPSEDAFICLGCQEKKKRGLISHHPICTSCLEVMIEELSSGDHREPSQEEPLTV